MSPIVDGVEASYQNQIVVKRVNALEEEGAVIMKAYRIPGHPTTLVFDSQGQETARFIGPQSKETLMQAVEKALSR